MNQPKQPVGNFTMNLNYRRKKNEKDADISGVISTPEEPAVEYPYKAFLRHSDKGRYWIGPVEMNRSLRQALTSETALRGTNFVAIRENGFKTFKEMDDGSPNPAYQALTAEQQQKEDSKPAFWATWTRTEAEPQLRASAWERDPNRYGPWASGNVQNPLTREQLAALDPDYANASETFVNPPQPAPSRRGKADHALSGR